MQTINSIPFSGLLNSSLHQFECRQKAETDEAYQSQLFHWPDEKGDLYFSRQLGLFRYDDFHHNNSTKNT